MALITSCDPIDPYTKSGVFGISFNGGYKPDRTLQWIPPDTNVIDEKDDFVPPITLPPPNILMNTCETRKLDPRAPGIPTRSIQYDDQTESTDDVVIPIGPIIKDTSKADEEKQMTNLLILLTLLLLVLLFVTRLGGN